MIEVSQEARDAAAAYHRKTGSAQQAIDFILSPHSDQDSLVQAFQRVIEEAVAGEREANAKVLAHELREQSRFPSGQPRISPETALAIVHAAYAAIRARIMGEGV